MNKELDNVLKSAKDPHHKIPHRRLPPHLVVLTCPRYRCFHCYYWEDSWMRCKCPTLDSEKCWKSQVKTVKNWCFKNDSKHKLGLFLERSEFFFLSGIGRESKIYQRETKSNFWNFPGIRRGSNFPIHTEAKTNFLSDKSPEFDIWKMWILWKMSL